MIELNNKINLEIEVFCKKCDIPMLNTGKLGDIYLFSCAKCQNVIEVILKIKN